MRRCIGMGMTQAQAADTLREFMDIVLDRRIKEALKIAVETLREESCDTTGIQIRPAISDVA